MVQWWELYAPTADNKSHKDHSASIPNALKFGLSVFSNKEVQSIHPQVKVLENGKKAQIGGFRVQPVPLFHNTDCIGFLIEHKSIGKLLFCTDTNSIPYRFKDVDFFAIEANYDAELMIDAMCNDVYSQSASENHMEINDTIDFLKNNQSSSLSQIILLHLSKGNSNANEFKKRVQDELGIMDVHIADKGVVVNLDKEDF